MSTYKVWCPEFGYEKSDHEEIEADNEQEAAEMWADAFDRNSADYLIVSGKEKPIIFVESILYETQWETRGRSVPVYDAEQIFN